jgi:hypothetical protein
MAAISQLARRHGPVPSGGKRTSDKSHWLIQELAGRNRAIHLVSRILTIFCRRGDRFLRQVWRAFVSVFATTDSAKLALSVAGGISIWLSTVIKMLVSCKSPTGETRALYS